MKNGIEKRGKKRGKKRRRIKELGGIRTTEGGRDREKGMRQRPQPVKPSQAVN